MAVVTGGALVPLLAVPVRAAGATTTPAPPPPASTTPAPPPPASTTPAPPAPVNPNPARVSVRVTGSRVSQPIPSGFVGFSFEFQAVRDYTGSDPHAINPVLVQLIRDVAPEQTPVLRIGGNSTDQTWWPSPDVTPSPGVIYTLTKSWLATTRALAVATGAKLILGVNLKLDSPAEAAAEARAYRAGIGLRNIEALEIGNEPELYKVFPYYEEGGVPFYARPPTYDFASYAEDVAAIAKRVPRVALAGPATGMPSWLAKVPQLFTAEPRLKIVTYHRYPLLACFSQPDDPRYPSIPNLLTPNSARDLLSGIGDAISFAHSHGATVRIDELNSVACSGQPGVSDTFASALWMLDTLFAMARAGVDGVNIHTLPDASYEPFVFRRIRGRWLATVRPDYYSLLMFSEAAPPGARMLGVEETASTDVRSRATRHPRRRDPRRADQRQPHLRSRGARAPARARPRSGARASPGRERSRHRRRHARRADVRQRDRDRHAQGQVQDGSGRPGSPRSLPDQAARLERRDAHVRPSRKLTPARSSYSRIALISPASSP